MQSNQLDPNMCINAGITVKVGRKAKYQQKVKSHKISLLSAWLCYFHI